MMGSYMFHFLGLFVMGAATIVGSMLIATVGAARRGGSVLGAVLNLVGASTSDTAWCRTTVVCRVPKALAAETLPWFVDID